MTRRPGLSLLEILMTIFIMALGLLGILTLFPLAASQMAIAVREDRSAQAASQADAFFRSYWKAQVVEQPNGGTEPFYQALTSPGDPTLLPPGVDEVSYPVFVDPMGFFARSGLVNQTWVGDLNAGLRSTNVPRRSLTIVTINPSNLYSMRLCSLPDSLSYNDDGQPVTPGSGITEREWRYNWAWVIQRPSNRNFSAATMTVVVYDKRPPLFTPVGAEAVFNSVTFNPTSTTLVVPGVPDVKPGGWVMDATITPGTAIRQANFYQVVSVTPNGANTILELQVPIKTRSDNSNTSYNGTLVVLRGVSGVYSRPSLGN